MSDDLHYIDRLFHKAIEGEEEPPPPHIWEQIDRRLEKNTIVSITQKYSTLKRMAVALLAVVFALGMYALQVTYKNRQAANAGIKTGGQKTATTPALTDATPSKKEPSSDSGDETINNIAGENEAKPAPNSITHMDMADQKGIKPYAGEQHKIAIENNTRSQLLNTKFTPTKAGDNAITVRKRRAAKRIIDDNNENNNKTESLSPYVAATAILDMPVLKVSMVPLLTSHMDSDKLLPLSSPNRTVPAIATPYPLVVHRVRNKAAFSLSVFFSPEQSRNRISSPTPALPRERIRDEFERKEQYGASFTVGVLGNYSFSRNWNLESGLTFSGSSIQIAPKTIYAQHDGQGRVRYRYNSSSGYIDIEPKGGNIPVIGDSVLASHSKSTLHYIGVPLQLRYVIKMGKASISPAVGLSANFLTKGEMKTFLPNSTQNDKQERIQVNGLRSVYFSGTTSIGFEYKLNSVFSINVSPTIRFALSSINKEVLVQSYPSSLGIALGLRISF